MSLRVIRAARALLTRHAMAFMAGDLHVLAESYSLPCPARDFAGQEVILTRPEHIIAPMAALRESCLARGMTGVDLHILSSEIARGGRARIWVRWEHVYPDHVEAGDYDVIYTVALLFGARLVIERAEYVTPGDDILPSTAAG